MEEFEYPSQAGSSGWSCIGFGRRPWTLWSGLWEHLWARYGNKCS